MSKGGHTKERILERAFQRASRDGLEGVTIGGLATELGLSKSGLFAHFGSKEELQLQVLHAAATRFTDAVVRPALAMPRGEARIRGFFENWLNWGDGSRTMGGCLFVAAAAELDDRPGPQRDFLVQSQKQWLATLAKAAALAIEAGDFRPDLDIHQFAFEFNAFAFGYHHSTRLLRDPDARVRAHSAFERLMQSARR